ncbi:hypothetical protein, partial [Pseudomonas helmanticensis]|uniref:hypothetical protein n=1 Tax=Pseudomonas helmanticensis TaxID=1471381 RepID=UPI0038185A6B
SALRARDASWQQQDQASGFLNNQAGQIAAFWRCPCPTGKARHTTKHRQPAKPAAHPLKPGFIPNILQKTTEPLERA